MKKHITIGLMTLYMSMGFAQRHELGLQFGGSFISGDAKSSIKAFPDIGTNRRVTPSYIGGFYRRNLNPHQGVRLDLAYNIAFFENVYDRTEKVSNDILEGSLMFEYAFFPINDELKRGESKFTPYAFAGISGLMIDSPAFLVNVAQRWGNIVVEPEFVGDAHKKKFTLGIPFGLGVRYKFYYNWSIFAEAKFRYTFTDNLDFSNLEKMNHTIQYNGVPASSMPAAQDAVRQYLDSKKRGGSTDWLNSLLIGVSYSFGRPPCHCTK